MNPYRIQRQNQYYRFITSGLIHKDHIHLLFNMFSLYFFGVAIESIFKIAFGEFGWVYYVALYLMAVVVSDLPTYFKNRNNIYYNSLGASGGVSAVIFAFVLFRPLDSICLYVFICLPGFIMGLLFVVFSYYQGKKSADNINHDAHLYGAMFGLLFCAVLYPRSISLFVEQLMQWRLFQ